MMKSTSNGWNKNNVRPLPPLQGLFNDIANRVSLTANFA
jgi:hypothetical protein